jgi:predicted alpha/beta superfamily hydrolase
MYRRVAMGLLSLAVVLCPTVRAADKTDDNRIVIDSKVLGEQRIALVKTPDGYDRGELRYPVLYMTDGAAQLDHTASTIEFLARNGRMPQMIVVAIANTVRTRDLTPTTPKPNANPGIPLPPGPTGGADKFLKFVETELIPQVEKTYRTQPYRIFAGHSLGGLLAVHAFATKNDLFNAYLAVSPTLWWDRELPIREMADFLKDRKELDCRLVITKGNEKGAMITSFEKAKQLLGKQQLKDFVWDSAVIEDEDHGTVVLRGNYFGLKKFFDGWNPDLTVMGGGLPAIEKFYADLSKKYKYTIVPAENLLNQIGYVLLENGRNDDAIAVLKAAAEHYPNSANCFDSLAEVYEKSGKLGLAAPNYQRAVEVGTKNADPNLPIYKTNFERVSKALKKTGNATGR